LAKKVKRPLQMPRCGVSGCAIKQEENNSKTRPKGCAAQYRRWRN
jgi:hypothetical protein